MHRTSCIALALAAFLLTGTAHAHFGMVIPDREIVSNQKQAGIKVTLAFAHPMAREGMDLVRPAAFFVALDGNRTDLLPALTKGKLFDHPIWQTEYKIQKPGLYQFVMEPEPYWEAAEDCYIVHYTKTFVSAFGGEDGWDQPLGLKTEIVPLTRPFGNYSGNVFQGRVLLDGKPVPGAEVEVEFYNQAGKYQTPDEAFQTQVVKADDSGVFTYAVPFAGWWGFAALNTAAEKKDYEGKPKNVELGAVLWARFVEPQRSRK